MGIPLKSLNTWIGDSPERRQIIDILDYSAIEINYIHEAGDDRSWGLIIKLPQDLADVIGTQREVLLWATLHPEAQARDINQAVQVLRRHSLRVAQDVLLMVTADPNGGMVLHESSDNLPLAVMAVTLNNLRGFRPRGSELYTDAIRARLFARDLYDFTDTCYS